MTLIHPSMRRVGVGLAILLAAASATTAILRFYSAPFTGLPSSETATVCTTIATDPNPPLNVRSSPVVASDNIIDRLQNGTPLGVIDEQAGWLRLNSPRAGWVSKQLTVTSCVPAAAESDLASSDQGSALLAQATELYHTGNLTAAIELAKTIPTTSAVHSSATGAMLRWQAEWGTAAMEFQTAQKALQDGRWPDVLKTVDRFPDNRFWKEKLAPLVAEAIKQQHSHP